MKKIYGFTGTREGMNSNQKKQIKQLLQKDLDIGVEIEVHHGDCIGADKDFHDICCELSSDIEIIIHPGGLQTGHNSLRAYCKSDTIKPIKDYLDRNRDIVDMSDALIACPISDVEILRSGTWYTIRYARKVNTPILMFV